ncbi:hypothetical protein [Rhodopseudomonas palustris]|uniref:hypothetical protein n=1 Tax=Rhodopseudomonas palustris TaxID=1076 RepID=UPI000E5BDFA1|nr:hypothetical protein [Rhodopseudomonas palustris]QLH70238.1 hypothetical protein HZF03_05355 [Rhodopseudomonas palustris]RHZ90560.1 hypothetical protein D1920_24030 [Rhodopseudomonas palustris]
MNSPLDVKDLMDLGLDPVVVFNPPSIGTPDRIERYHAALEWLIGRERPFVLVTRADGDEASESHEDRKSRAVWFKNNLMALVQVCRGFVYVEQDEARRAAWQARAEGMAKTFPVPMIIAGDMEAAITQALDLVAASRDPAPGGSPHA